MHNIDRTNPESSYGEYAGEYQGEGEYMGEYAGEYPGEFTGEYAGEYPGEFAGESYGEYPGEYAGEYAGEYGNAFEAEAEGEGEYGNEGPFSEAEEMELAAELLSVQSEAELDQFLGKLFKKAGGFLRSPIGRHLTGALKGVAKRALPIVGSTLGNAIVPGLGGVIGGKLATTAGSMFGLELEGLSYEDQEYEIAKQVVRLGGAAANEAAQAPPNAPPAQVAQTALTSAAQQFAPGLVRSTGYQPHGRRRGGCRCRNAGRWVRSRHGLLLLGS